LWYNDHMFKFPNYNIILPKYLEIVKKKGSSFIFSAQGRRGKEKNCKPAEKIAVGSEGVAEGGFGGNSAFLLLKRNGNGSSRVKIPSPQPPSFLPAYLGFAPKTFGRTLD